MIELALILTIISVATFYFTSSKIEHSDNKFIINLATHKLVARLIALMLSLIATILFVQATSIAIGIIFSTVIWMLGASLISLFSPIYKHTVWVLIGTAVFFFLTQVIP